MEIDFEKVVEDLKSKFGTAGAFAPAAPDLNSGSLSGVDCPICNNTGRLLRKENGALFASECSCVAKRQALRSARNSGLEGLMGEYTFKAYTTPTEQLKATKAKAVEYVKGDPLKWFYIFGVPGSGKTHICVAICSALIDKGKTVKYVLWRDIAQKLKANINDAEYSRIINSFIRADVLYIDDFLKGTVSDADMNRAFEIINARYNMPGKRTIISSERDIKFVRGYDEAVGSRIWQRSKGFCIKAPDINWRN